MFTGIVETIGTLIKIEKKGSNLTFYVKSSISHQLKIDESVSHNGICLTVELVEEDVFKVTAIQETIDKTNAGLWKAQESINLERSMIMNGRLDGHIVQGHVDGTAICLERLQREGSVEFTFKYDPQFAALIIEKGSICVNGVSLTAFNITDNTFTVAIIPYTFAHTNFKLLNEGAQVNIEYDILGKYVARIMNVKKSGND